MKLQAIRVQNYKSIDDSGWVDIDDLTCLIGKNESGKTAFMEAIELLNPTYGTEIEPYDMYPRSRWPEYSDRHEEDPDPLVSARLILDDNERSLLAARVGELPSSEVLVTKTYAGELRWEFDIDEAAYVDRVVSDHDVPGSIAADLRQAETVAELRSAVGDADDGSVDELSATIPEGSVDRFVNELGNELLAPELPEFRYVGEYTILDSEIEIGPFLDRQREGEATASDRVFHSLLSVAGLDIESLGDDDWERTLTELEAASAEITEAVTRYWSQADNLGIDLRSVGDGDTRTLALRVESARHGVSVSFDQRSRGLRWFFSTVCTVSDLRSADENVVLLLDEPGLHLHAKAKREFLTFLEREFADEQTLVYSTHSPFMIDTDRAHRTKLISKDGDGRTTVLDDPSEADSYTRFPLQNVFELDVMSTVLSRSQLLLLRDATTYKYLYNISELLEDTDTRGLDYRWTALPIGSLDNLETVRALFDMEGRDVAVVQEGPEAGWSPPGNVTVAAVESHVDVRGDATIEDVLSTSFYLDLASRAYAGVLADADGDVPDRITEAELDSVAPEGPIVERLRAYFEAHDLAGGTFDRSRPADHLQRHRSKFVETLDMETKRRFGTFARELNSTLEEFDGKSRRSQSFLGSLFGG